MTRAGGDLRRQIVDLAARMRSLSRRYTAVASMAQAASTSAAASPKKFRLGSLGGTVTGSVRWSSPMPTSDYAVDATIPAVGTTVWSYTVTTQTAGGCTIQFTAPVLLSLGTIVIVAGVSPSSTG